MTIHVGAQLDRFPGPKYVKSLHFAELSFREPLPRPATLARYRREAPESLRIALVAPKACVVAKEGPLRLESLGDRVKWLNEAADALGAIAVVVQTGSDVSTGQRDRARLEAYFGALRKVAGRSLVWSPSGLWEDEEAARMAAKLGAVLAVDPLGNDVPEGPIAYARIRTMGTRSRLSTGLLMEAAEALEASGAGTAYVSVASATSFRDARSLASLIAGAAVKRESGEDEDESFDDDESYDDEE